MVDRKEFFSKWISALRSGEYTKVEYVYGDNGCFCTLGLGGHLLNSKDVLTGVSSLFLMFPEIWATDGPPGLRVLYTEITSRNDGEGIEKFDFNKMADFLEEVIKP